MLHYTTDSTQLAKDIHDLSKAILLSVILY